MDRPTLDYADMLRPVRGGVEANPDLWRERLRTARATFDALRDAGRLGFLELPDPESVETVRELAERWRGSIDDVLVLGIGGSALGSLALRDALLGADWNEADARRAGRPRLHVLDNVEPHRPARLLERLDPERTVVNVISKSGGTAETLALYLVVRRHLEATLGARAAERLVFTTDPERGALRRIARREGIATLDVPPAVGGRFSVLSPVGCSPLALCGVDPEALAVGAAEARSACLAEDVLDNPAALFAVLLHAAHADAARSIHVLMPYGDRLRSLAAWFQQLWAESLGKKRSAEGRHEHVGLTPLIAVGATDQHAQVQLFMEGPEDKVVVFLGVTEPGVDVAIPRLHEDDTDVSYLGGHTLAELLRVERTATRTALREAGRPSMTLEVAALDERVMGWLFTFFQVATVLAGGLYGVDPLDQPGVELGKRLTYGALGREGYDAPAPVDAPGPGRRV